MEKDNSEINKEHSSALVEKSDKSAKRPRRPRSLTTLKLEVIAERARKIKRIKDSVSGGTYSVNASAVSKNLINLFKI